MTSLSPLLGGSGTVEGIVAVQQADDGQMRLFLRTPEGISTRLVPFFPFFHLSDRRLLDGFPRKHWIKPLEGEFPLSLLCAFETWSSMWQAIRHVLDAYGRSAGTRPESFAAIDALHLVPDATAQYLLETGETLFKGVKSDTLRRLHVAVGFTRDKTRKVPAGAVQTIALADNSGWQLLLKAGRRSERELLHKFTQVVLERDPDVIAAHGLTRQLLPRLLARGESCQELPGIGRDQTPPRLAEWHAGEGAFAQPLWEVTGRHLLDADRLSLIAPPPAFSITPAEETGIPGASDVPPEVDDAEALLNSVVAECAEWTDPAALLFHACQILPLDFGALARSLPAQRAEGIFLREYVRQRQALPLKHTHHGSAPKHVEHYATGLYGPVQHIRLEHVFTDTLLREDIAPRNDTLSVFRSALSALREKVTVHAHGEDSSNASKACTWIMHAFVDYLLSGTGLFGDPGTDLLVWKGAKANILSSTETVRKKGGKILAIDENELMFAQPHDISHDIIRRKAVSLSVDVASGTTVLGDYLRALCFKARTFALLDKTARIWWAGHPLVPRGAEAFGRKFVQECTKLLLEQDLAGAHALYIRMHQAILERQLEVGDFLRVEVLRDSLTKYDEDVKTGKRKHSPAYELAKTTRKSPNSPIPVSYYITSTDSTLPLLERYKLAEMWDRHFRDEDAAYYLQRLVDFASKFEVFFDPKDFQAIFSPEGLFPIDPGSIRMRSADFFSEEDDFPEKDFGIWLDL